MQLPRAYFGAKVSKAQLRTTFSHPNVISASHPVEVSCGYANEAGFLNGFTESEKLAVKTVEQKQLLDHSEYEFSENYHRAEYPVDDVLQNYDSAASETTTDKMFLLDVKQFYDVYINFGDYCYAYPTALAVANDTNTNRTRGSLRQTASNNDYPQKDKTYYYWLRTPFNNSRKYTYIKNNDVVTEIIYSAGCSSRVAGLKDGYHNNETVTFELDCMNDIGVRPAFYLDTADANITGGAGTETNAYVINGTQEAKIIFGDADGDNEVTASDAALILQRALKESTEFPAEKTDK